MKRNQESFDDFAKYLKETAEEDQITLFELAKKYKVTEATISNWKTKLRVDFEATWEKLPTEKRDRVNELLGKSCSVKEIARITELDRELIFWYRGQWSKLDKQSEQLVQDAIDNTGPELQQDEGPDKFNATQARSRVLYELATREDLSGLSSDLLAKTVIVLTNIINRKE